MKRAMYAAIVAALLSPPVAAEPQAAGADRDDLDEVIVVGRDIVTGIAEVEVEREMLVDTATVLKDIPGANVNAKSSACAPSISTRRRCPPPTTMPTS